MWGSYCFDKRGECLEALPASVIDWQQINITACSLSGNRNWLTTSTSLPHIVESIAATPPSP